MRRKSLTRLPAMLQMALALLLLAAPRALYAHGHLRAATPAAGARLAAPPAEIRLTFSEAPELAETTVALVAADGREVSLAPLATAGVLTVVAGVNAPLPPGEYRVIWRMVAADGHPTHGQYAFTVQATSAVPGHQSGAGRSASGRARAEAAVLDASSPPLVAIRFLTYAALILVMGMVAFRLLVLARLAARRRAPGAAALETGAAATAARLGGLAAAALLAIEAARLLAQSAALNGSAALEPSRLATLVGHTHWGEAWLLQALATAVALLAFRLARAGRRGGWLLAAISAAGVALATALGGHAAVSRLPLLAVAADALHLAGASGWLGSLAATMAAGVVVALRAPAEQRAPAVAGLVDAFSPAALVCATVTALTGILAAWLQIGHLPALTGTPYGRVLLVKLGLVAGAGLVGAYNWLRVKPALGTDVATTRLRHSATVELAIGLLLVLATAILVGLPTPAAM